MYVVCGVRCGARGAVSVGRVSCLLPAVMWCLRVTHWHPNHVAPTQSLHGATPRNAVAGRQCGHAPARPLGPPMWTRTPATDKGTDDGWAWRRPYQPQAERAGHGMRGGSAFRRLARCACASLHTACAWLSSSGVFMLECFASVRRCMPSNRSVNSRCMRNMTESRPLTKSSPLPRA